MISGVVPPFSVRPINAPSLKKFSAFKFGVANTESYSAFSFLRLKRGGIKM